MALDRVHGWVVGAVSPSLLTQANSSPGVEICLRHNEGIYFQSGVASDVT